MLRDMVMSAAWPLGFAPLVLVKLPVLCKMVVDYNLSDAPPQSASEYFKNYDLYYAWQWAGIADSPYECVRLVANACLGPADEAIKRNVIKPMTSVIVAGIEKFVKG